MLSIADTVADLDRRIADSERRIIDLARRNTTEAAMLLVNAIEALRELRAFKARLENIAATSPRG